VGKESWGGSRVTPAQVKNIRRLTGRCEANIEELVNLLSKSTDNYALRCAAWADLAALLLSDIEACQAQQQAAVEDARLETLLEACKAVCPDCAKGRPVEIGGQGKNYFDSKVYYHWNDNDLLFWICNANAIRQRTAKE
jgi:hypothetical protein